MCCITNLGIFSSHTLLPWLLLYLEQLSVSLPSSSKDGAQFSKQLLGYSLRDAELLLDKLVGEKDSRRITI